jgi:hypothetical protein
MKPLQILRGAAGAMLLMLGGGGASAQRPDPVAALNAVERGEWQLRETNGGLRKVCLGNPSTLIQIRHPGQQCQYYVMDNGARTATVRYTCAGHGQGRTTLTVETGKLIRLETQGVADGSPFAEEYEGRLLGRCG